MGMLGMNVREKLHAFLAGRPEGASVAELCRQLFSGIGHDPGITARVLQGLLGDDARFAYEPAAGRWTLRDNQRLRVALMDASYVVVDLETTGGAPGKGAIIEIGACRMRGTRLLETFDSLVRPPGPIPRFISQLTSITDEMVAEAPTADQVMPAFRTFLGDAAIVAHNANFDLAFLEFEFRRLFGMAPDNPVLCTLRLSRRLLPSLRRRRLEVLAEHLGIAVRNRHRGLGDARMTAELFAILLEMACQRGTQRLDRLLELQDSGSSGRRIERHVPPESIAAIPEEPGVYIMRNDRGAVLYIGKAKRLRRRVASYFNGGMGLGSKVIDLVNHTHAVETQPTASSLEAALLEARLIRELKPPYNSRLKSEPVARFIRIDRTDPFPRISVTSRLSARLGHLQFGPFVGRQRLDWAAAVLSRMLGLRVCTGALNPAPEVSPCIYGQMEHCAAPCNHSIRTREYGERLDRAIAFLRGRSTSLMAELAAARDQAAAAMRFEEAQRRQRELDALHLLSVRQRRLSQVVNENSLVILIARKAFIVLSGRLAHSITLTTAADLAEIASFVAANYEIYRARPVTKADLEHMAVVARWLRERDATEGELIFLTGPHLPIEAIAERLTQTAPIARAEPSIANQATTPLRSPE